MRHYLSLVLSSFLLCTLVYTCPVKSAPKYASIIVDGNTGRVLHQASADATSFPASLTKMMTLYLMFEALESGKLKIKQTLPVSKHAARQAPVKIYFKPGNRISVKDALLALLVRSANDVAVVVAEAIAGNETRFAQIMTNKARKLGMYNTVFRNASGLPNKQQKTTARDMVILSRALYDHFPDYYRYFSTRQFTFRGRRYRNENKLLGKVPGVDGIKTGFICASGFNLAASAARSGNRLFGVVMGGKSGKWRDQHMTQLLNTAFKKVASQPRFIPIPPTRPNYNQPISPPKRPEDSTQDIYTVETEIPQDWVIQVGAFKGAQNAHKLAAAVRGKFDLLQNSNVVITPLIKNKRKFYQAQLTGLDKSQAKNICDLLKQLGEPCQAFSQTLLK